MSEQRKVSTLLGLGILLFPAIFAWFTLRKGHSGLSKVIAFGWLIVCLGFWVANPNRADQNQNMPAEANAFVTQAASMVPNAAVPKVEPEEQEIDTVPRYGNGVYLVGKDIQSGIYRVILKDNFLNMGYVERKKDLDMGFNSIIANIVLTGDGYVEIKKTDVAVKLQGVEIFPIDLKTLEPNIKTVLSGGIYLVGYDIQPGTYKVEVTDTATNVGYVERARSVAMGMKDIIANDVVQGQGYVKVKKRDFAIKVQGATLTLQE